MLFGASTGQYVSGRDLSTLDVLELILYIGRDNPDTFHVGFSFEYDVNMILKDLPWRMLAILTDTGQVIWNGYRIKHIPHKLFTISKAGVSVTIFDVFGFFHTSYLRALRKFQIGTAAVVERIAHGKGNRGHFTYSDLPEVLKYWRDEISLLPPLMDKLRESCYSAGFYITQWHGPGALASYVLKENKVNDWHPKKGSVPKPVMLARRLAYAGGRFQDWKCGVYDGPVFTADINSAYAAAVCNLPNLATGFWRRIPKEKLSGIHSPKDISRFAVYNIRYDARKYASRAQEHHIPFPLFHRDTKGFLTWPPFTEGWYWTPEANTVAGSPEAEFLDGWEFVHDGSYPFRDLIRSAFDKRLELQKVGDYAEKAYKWFLASIYGQFAQRVGWDRNTRNAPKSHVLEWAGYITSYCRALVYMGAKHIAKQGGLVSIDTDGITSTIPFTPSKLIGGIGTALGQWKLENFSGIVHWQNGIYWLREPETGEWTDPKTRGIPRGKLGRESALRSITDSSLGRRIETQCTVNLRRERFIGYRQGLQHQWDNWRTWKPESVAVTFGGTGKGRHVPSMCSACRGVSPAYLYSAMHTVTHLWSTETLSQPHDLPWLAPRREKESCIVYEGGIWEDETV
jgi:DNA polymerase type B, organellar and viral